MADDPLDIIASERATLRAAFKKATADADKQAIGDKIDELADLEEKFILDQFQTTAERIQALSDTLNGIIRDLRNHIDSFFLDDLKKIGTENGLLPQQGQGTADDVA